MWRGSDYRVFIASYRQLLTTQLEHRQIDAAEPTLLQAVWAGPWTIYMKNCLKKYKRNI